jgi:hypothetical protein
VQKSHRVRFSHHRRRRQVSLLVSVLRRARVRKIVSVIFFAAPNERETFNIRVLFLQSGFGRFER